MIQQRSLRFDSQSKNGVTLAKLFLTASHDHTFVLISEKILCARNSFPLKIKSFLVVQIIQIVAAQIVDTIFLLAPRASSHVVVNAPLVWCGEPSSLLSLLSTYSIESIFSNSVHKNRTCEMLFFSSPHNEQLKHYCFPSRFLSFETPLLLVISAFSIQLFWLFLVWNSSICSCMPWLHLIVGKVMTKIKKRKKRKKKKSQAMLHGREMRVSERTEFWLKLVTYNRVHNQNCASRANCSVPVIIEMHPKSIVYI